MIDQLMPIDLPTQWREVATVVPGARAYSTAWCHVIASVEDRGTDTGIWLHVSVSKRDKLPSWDEVRLDRAAAPVQGPVTAPAGATVRIYIDLAAEVAIGDVIETQTGRRYGVTAVRVQQRGKSVGRQHLRCVVLERSMTVRQWVQTTIHQIRWYRRGRSRR